MRDLGGLGLCPLLTGRILMILEVIKEERLIRIESPNTKVKVLELYLVLCVCNL